MPGTILVTTFRHSKNKRNGTDLLFKYMLACVLVGHKLFELNWRGNQVIGDEILLWMEAGLLIVGQVSFPPDKWWFRKGERERE